MNSNPRLRPKSQPNPSTQSTSCIFSNSVPIPTPIPGSSTSPSPQVSIKRASTIYDYSSLRLRPDGSRVSQVPSSNLTPRITKGVVRDLRGNWIARDAGGGFGRVPKTTRKKKKVASTTEPGHPDPDGTIAAIQEVGEVCVQRRKENGRAAKKRRVMEDLDFLDSRPPQLADPTPALATLVPASTYGSSSLVEDSTQVNSLLLPYKRVLALPLPSSDLLKFIHHFASSFYHERGELVNATSTFRREKRARKRQRLRGERNNTEGARETAELTTGSICTRLRSHTSDVGDAGIRGQGIPDDRSANGIERLPDADQATELSSTEDDEQEGDRGRGKLKRSSASHTMEQGGRMPKVQNKGKATDVRNSGRGNSSRSTPISRQRNRAATPSSIYSSDSGPDAENSAGGDNQEDERSGAVSTGRRIKRRRKLWDGEKTKHQRDMYKVFDGSALMAIGMLIQEHISKMVEPRIPPGWEEVMSKLAEYSDDEESMESESGHEMDFESGSEDGHEGDAAADDKKGGGSINRAGSEDDGEGEQADGAQVTREAMEAGSGRGWEPSSDLDSTNKPTKYTRHSRQRRRR